MSELKVAPGHPLYPRVLAALFLIGVSTFGLMYTVQPLMVPIGTEFGQPAAQTAWVMSATTLGIAVFVLPLGWLSPRFGRRRSMLAGLALATICGLLVGTASSWWVLVAARGLMGAGLAFVIVSAMAWVVAHAAPSAVTRMGGLYISGTTLGGMSGRLIAAGLADLFDWRMGVLLTSGLAVVAGAIAHLLLPGTQPRPVAPAIATAGGGEGEGDREREGEGDREREGEGDREGDPNRALRVRFYLVAACGMGVFVGIYNVMGYRVAGPPFGLSTTVTGLLFLTYLAATFTSALAGRLAARYRMGHIMAGGLVVAAAGVAVTLIDHLVTTIVGLLLLAGGFFAAHSVANASAARYSPSPALSSATYTLSYYGGSAVGGLLLGWAWDAGGWPLVVGLALGLLALATASGATAVVRGRPG